MLRTITTPTEKLIFRRFFGCIATVSKPNVPTQGNRFIVKQDAEGNKLDSPILVARVKDAFYAIDATCPHMKKPMAKGKIHENTLEIQCPIHNSRFSLETGVCTNWVTGVLGYDNKVVSGLAQRVGGEKRDIKACEVIENEDGSLTIQDGVVQEKAA